MNKPQKKTHPLLVKEWDYSKNAPFSPQDVTYGSKKKVWWKCSVCSNEWEAAIKNRAHGTGCPYCANRCKGKKITDSKIRNRSSLREINPVLANEWHPTKNGELTPDDIAAKSKKKVWWKCHDCGYEWAAVVYSRHTRGCPACAGKVVVVGFNDLKTVNPTLAEEWHPTKNGNLLPSMITQSAGCKVWWKCRVCGYEWETSPNKRTDGRGCPNCSLKIQGENLVKNRIKRVGALSDTNPELTKEWNYDRNGELTPDMITAGSSKNVWWRCSQCGYEWQQTVNTRNIGHSCPQCANEQQTSFPEQAVYYYLNNCFSAENRKKLFGFEVDVWISTLNIAVEYDGRYFHSLPGSVEKDYRKECELAKHGIKMFRIKEGDNNEVYKNVVFYNFDFAYTNLPWAISELVRLIDEKSVCDIDFTRDISLIQQQYIYTKKSNSLLVVYPDIARDWHPTKNGLITPEMVSKGSHKIVWWKCSHCGYEWQRSINDRTNKMSSCPKCANQNRKDSAQETYIRKRESLADKYPQIASEWNYELNNPLTPDTVSGGSSKKVWWICSNCENVWTATITNRTSRGSKCPICFGYKQVLAVSNPQLASEWHPTKNGNLTPKNVLAGSNKMVWWCCKQGHEWQAIINSRKEGNGSCPYCSGKSNKSDST
jgi:rubrerythrin